MKILITSDWYKPVINGVVTSIVSLSNGLTALGHDVRVLTLSHDRHSYIKETVTYIGSIGVGKIYPNARIKAANSSQYVQDLIDWKPDVIHSQCELSTFFLACKIAESCRCPLVHTYHTVYEDFTHYFSPSIRLGKYVVAALSRRIMAKTQAVIVPTKKVQTMLAGYGVQSPVFVVPSGLELEQFKHPMTASERTRLRAQLGFSENDCVLIYLGRLAKEKNLEELFDLLAQNSNADVKMLVVGDGPHREQLKQKAARLGLQSHIIFTGMVAPKQAARYYQLGDIFVSASQSETQGLTYIEAMASGLPLLCRADDCLNDVIENGKNGCVYHDTEEFQHILNRLMTDAATRTELGRAARETALMKYSSRGFAWNALQVYQQQCREHRKQDAFLFATETI